MTKHEVGEKAGILSGIAGIVFIIFAWLPMITRPYENLGLPAGDEGQDYFVLEHSYLAFNLQALVIGGWLVAIGFLLILGFQKRLRSVDQNFRRKGKAED